MSDQPAIPEEPEAPKTKGPHDPNEINPKLTSDIHYWANEFHVTGQQLHEAIRVYVYNGITPMMLFTWAGMAFVGIGQVVLWSFIQDATPDQDAFATAWVQVLGAVGLGLVPVIAAKMVATSGD